MGVVPPGPAFSSGSASGASANGALLVLDEVITGFRVARGGAQELSGVERRPDDHGQGDRRRAARPRPTAAAATCSRWSRPAGDVYQAGTLSGNPLATAAGLATLAELDAAAYARLAELTERSPPACATPPPRRRRARGRLASRGS